MVIDQANSLTVLLLSSIWAKLKKLILRQFKKFLEILRSNVVSWSYTDLDSIEKVIEIIGEGWKEKNISHEFVKDLSLWIERKKCQGAFEGLRWDEFDW